MAKLWNTRNKKTAVTISMIVVAWYILSASVSQIPSLPGIVTKGLVMGISLLTVAAVMVAYGAMMLWRDY